MKLRDILIFLISGYAPDLPTALFAQALKNTSDRTSAVFLTSELQRFKTCDGKLLSVTETE